MGAQRAAWQVAFQAESAALTEEGSGTPKTETGLAARDGRMIRNPEKRYVVLHHGGGTTLTTNFGQILSASGAEGSLTPTCVSLFGARKGARCRRTRSRPSTRVRRGRAT